MSRIFREISFETKIYNDKLYSFDVYFLFHSLVASLQINTGEKYVKPLGLVSGWEILMKYANTNQRKAIALPNMQRIVFKYDGV